MLAYDGIQGTGSAAGLACDIAAWPEDIGLSHRPTVSDSASDIRRGSWARGVYSLTRLAAGADVSSYKSEVVKAKVSLVCASRCQRVSMSRRESHHW